MKKHVFYKLVVILGIFGLVGCADATVTSSQDNSDDSNSDGSGDSGNRGDSDGGQSGNNGNSDGGSSGDSDNGGSGTDTGDEDDDLIEIDVGVKCPNAGYSVCQEDRKTLWYCDTESFKIQEKVCDEVCYNGSCTAYTSNSCDNPYIVTLDTPLTGGATLTGNTYPLPSKCTMNTEMGVAQLQVPTAGFYKVNVTANGATSWGNVLSPDCDSSEAIWVDCALTSGSDNFPIFLDAGNRYLFVAPGKLLASHFTFDVSFQKVDETASDTNYCKYDKYKYHIVNMGSSEGFGENETLDNGTPGKAIYTIASGTQDGTSVDDWNNNSSAMSCKIMASSVGREKVYLVSMQKPGILKAELSDLSYTDDEGNTQSGVPTSGVALYLKSCSGETYGQISGLNACVDTQSEASISWSKSLNEGEYLIFVDTRAKKDVNFKLTLTRTDN